MENRSRSLDPLELQDEFRADFMKGYEANITGEPISAGNGTSAWQDGWLEANQDVAPAEIRGLD